MSDSVELRGQVRRFLAKARADGVFIPHCDAWMTGFDPAFSASLAERGWIGEDGTLTPAGRAAHNAVEAATDQAAERPWNRMGAVGLAEVADVLLPLAQACAAALPEVIPVGRLQPTRP